MTNFRIIKVTGKGEDSFSPDRIRVSFSVSYSNKEYEKVFEKHSLDTEKVYSVFTEMGFKKNDVKTESFNISPKFEYPRDGGQKLVGYEYIHGYYVLFDNDNELLSRVIENLSCSDLRPNVNVRYELKDIEKAKKTVLKKAVKDVEKKASVLAAASGVKIIELVSLNDSQETSFDGGLYMTDMASNRIAAKSLAMDINPADINVEQFVTAVYRIE